MQVAARDAGGLQQALSLAAGGCTRSASPFHGASIAFHPQQAPAGAGAEGAGGGFGWLGALGRRHLAFQWAFQELEAAAPRMQGLALCRLSKACGEAVQEADFCHPPTAGHFPGQPPQPCKSCTLGRRPLPPLPQRRLRTPCRLFISLHFMAAEWGRIRPAPVARAWLRSQTRPVPQNPAAYRPVKSAMFPAFSS